LSAIIGPNLDIQFPAGTASVSVFVETGNSSSPVLFDNIEFSNNTPYFYINHTVDGAPQSGINSCSDGINIAEGCVGFRDTFNDNLTYLSSIEQEKLGNGVNNLQTCVFDAKEAVDYCDSIPNTADTNVVIKVKNDRECAKWFSCETSMEDTGSTCLAIRACLKRNESTGECVEWERKLSSNQMGYDSDTSIVSQPNDPSGVQSIQYVSGLAQVGAQWQARCLNSMCIGGSLHNSASCTQDSDCAAAITYGYYPYNWMPERGTAGAQMSGLEIVPNGNFEAVYCDGPTDYSDGAVITNTVIPYSDPRGDAIERSRKESMQCTLDRHCRTAESDTKMQTAVEQADSQNTTPIEQMTYEAGWCGNVSADGTWKDTWFAINGAGMTIIDYEAGESYVTASAEGDGVLTSAFGAEGKDLNNVLYVQPSNNNIEGAQASLSKSIVPGAEYVLSFDAQFLAAPSNTSQMQIGIQHGSDTQNTDFFEVGSAKADIVFIVDKSGSMGSYIANIATNTTALVDELAKNNISFRTAIITVDGNKTPQVLDYSDYGDNDGSGFTNNSATFSQAMNDIAAHLGSGSAHTYEALKNVADNTFSVGGEAYQLQFEPGAQKFVILLTDTIPEQDPYLDDIDKDEDGFKWDDEDEERFQGTFTSVPYTLYSIVDYIVGDSSDADKAAAVHAYDELTAQFGGKSYDILTTDYSELLSNITGNITEQISDFTFTQNYEHYVLGPITMQYKTNSADSSMLFFKESNGSSNVPFVIDNVSLKPAVEVNQENNPHSSASSWLMGQECRGYPEQSSVSCDYIDTNGTIYTGWKGYCLEHDELDQDRCVAWWPIDVVSGTLDSSTSNRTIMRYGEKAPAYHCLVAKGNADLGACTDTGILCSNDFDCANNQCLGNGATNYYLPNKNSAMQVYVDTGGYTVKHTIKSLDLDVYWVSHGDPTDPNDDDFNEAAIFKKIEPSSVEKLIHISEIDHMQFFLGTPIYVDNDPGTFAATDDEIAEERQAWWMDGTDADNTGRYTKNGFDTWSWELSPTVVDATPRLFQAAKVQKTETIFGNEWLEGQGNVDQPAEADDQFGSYAIQTGAWCGQKPCGISPSADELNNMDFVFVKGTTSYNNIETAPRILGNQSVYHEGTPFNPFEEFSYLRSNGAAWGTEGTNHGAITINKYNGVQSVNGVVFDSNYFPSRGVIDKDYSQSKCFDTEVDDDIDCGANVMGVKFDFEGGYLKNIYLFYWDGFHRFDAHYIEGITWTYFLREPCLLLVEGADSDAVATPWEKRVKQSSEYRTLDTNYAYNTEGYSFYGALGTQGTETPDKIDGLIDQKGADFTAAAAQNLPFVYLEKDAGSVLPYACIGTCDSIACPSDPDKEYAPGADCENDRWQGFAGVCSNTTLTDKTAYFCDDDDDCKALNLGVCMSSSSISKSGVSKNYTSYLQQLNAAAEKGWERYRLLFADLGGMAKRIWYADQERDMTTKLRLQNRNQGTLTSFIDGVESANGNGKSDTLRDFCPDNDVTCNAFANEQQGEFDFDSMELCKDNQERQSTDYCGIRPKVNNIQVNGIASNSFSQFIEMQNGDYATLTFASEANPEQEPLETIRIDWEAPTIGDREAFNEEAATVVQWEAASTPDHTFKHTYTCSKDSAHYKSADSNGRNACEYLVRIQVQDNWGFCSGNIHASWNTSEDPDTIRATDGVCTSYDEYEAIIYVKP